MDEFLIASLLFWEYYDVSMVRTYGRVRDCWVRGPRRVGRVASVPANVPAATVE